MSTENQNPEAGNGALENLPERPVADASQVKGGATTSALPTAPKPIPIPYPNAKPIIPDAPINPCW